MIPQSLCDSWKQHKSSTSNTLARHRLQLSCDVQMAVPCRFLETRQTSQERGASPKETCAPIKDVQLASRPTGFFHAAIAHLACRPDCSSQWWQFEKDTLCGNLSVRCFLSTAGSCSQGQAKQQFSTCCLDTFAGNLGSAGASTAHAKDGRCTGLSSRLESRFVTNLLCIQKMN